MRISIINNTQLLKEDIQRTIRAINRQLAEDFARYWHKTVEVRLEGWTGEQPDPSVPMDMRGDAVIYLWDEVSASDPAGYHDLTAGGVPFGFVFIDLARRIGEDWSVTLSQEVLELAMDPEVNLVAQGPHPDPTESGRQVFHWYELCDAVQATTYMIDEVRVSNFVLPHYFTHADEHRNHNDFLGTSLRSFGTSPGGYVGFFDPETGKHENWFDPNDAVAARRAEIKQDFHGALRVARHKGGNARSDIENLNHVHCDALIFEIDASLRGKNAPMQRARNLSRTVLGPDWSVRRSSGDPREFDAIYLGDTPIGFGQAWGLAHRLAADDAVVFAEPSLSTPVPGETDRPAQPGGDALRASSGGDDTHRPGTEDPRWAPKLCRIQQALKLVRDAGRGPGEGVRIGHPDSGYRVHEEMDPERVLSSLDFDFIDEDRNAVNPEGNHGLSTASVIMSGEGARDDKVLGAAQAGVIVPLRVTKPGLIRPTPVLLLGGMRRLRDAIDYAVRTDCAVISMSLGGPSSRVVKKAVERATNAGVIVLAAAGNEVGFVVWPARYENVVAVAGCNIDKKPWRGSSRGEDVDITAPGESVWRARYSDRNTPEVGRGNGTSYAVALTAGIAAVWIGFHGRDALAAKYGKERIAEVFLELLTSTASTDHDLPDGEFGAGIVDAEALLRASLPAATRGRTRHQATRQSSEDAVLATLADQLGIAPDALDNNLGAELKMAFALGAFATPTQSKPPTRKAARRIDKKISLPGVSRDLRAVLGR